jgi:hypothetical protein
MAKRRTQIYLTDEEIEVLSKESERTGRSMASLIRDAVDRVFGIEERGRRRRFSAALDASFGAWNDMTSEELDELARMRASWRELPETDATGSP